jgi:hypothetical protein
MTLYENLQKQLHDGPPGTARRELLATDSQGGWTVALTVDKQDELSCLAWEILVKRPASSGLELGQWAQAISERVNGLYEPLKVLEVDTLRNEAVLRSGQPLQGKDGSFYFEIFLKGASVATVRRYQVPQQANQRREQVTFALTHEGLFKLVGDLTSR